MKKHKRYLTPPWARLFLELHVGGLEIWWPCHISRDKPQAKQGQRHRGGKGGPIGQTNLIRALCWPNIIILISTSVSIKRQMAVELYMPSYLLPPTYSCSGSGRGGGGRGQIIFDGGDAAHARTPKGLAHMTISPPQF